MPDNQNSTQETMNSPEMTKPDPKPEPTPEALEANAPVSTVFETLLKSPSNLIETIRKVPDPGSLAMKLFDISRLYDFYMDELEKAGMQDTLSAMARVSSMLKPLLVPSRAMDVSSISPAP